MNAPQYPEDLEIQLLRYLGRPEDFRPVGPVNRFESDQNLRTTMSNPSDPHSTPIEGLLRKLVSLGYITVPPMQGFGGYHPELTERGRTWLRDNPA